MAEAGNEVHRGLEKAESVHKRGKDDSADLDDKSGQGEQWALPMGTERVGSAEDFVGKYKEPP